VISDASKVPTAETMFSLPKGAKVSGRRVIYDPTRPLTAPLSRTERRHRYARRELAKRN